MEKGEARKVHGDHDGERGKVTVTTKEHRLERVRRFQRPDDYRPAEYLRVLQLRERHPATQGLWDQLTEAEIDCIVVTGLVAGWPGEGFSVAGRCLPGSVAAVAGGRPGGGRGAGGRREAKGGGCGSQGAGGRRRRPWGQEAEAGERGAAGGGYGASGGREVVAGERGAVGGGDDSKVAGGGQRGVARERRAIGGRRGCRQGPQRPD
ncbi:glycine-rich cell wall structural protein 1.8-like [Cryptomeria japonica]|uniref:glycine-rich cell wall structural protein 1.8-like n=1 Tax=Cryptomeria japonica TaxID=3369 RepID=UPI0027DA45A1|nr:glycine-rich cell wall structural protein 1.8-like [Cryptomeria japonica]